MSGIVRARSGFTLIEMLFGLVIAGIIVGSAATLLRMQARSLIRSNIRIEATQRARFATGVLEREIKLLGSGSPNGQPMMVYGDADQLIFNTDLVTNEADDAIAVYYDPDASDAETMGLDSAAITLPNGSLYPRAWYGPGSTPGRAETLAFEFVQVGPEEYALVRRINELPADTLIWGIEPPTGGFFTYRALNPGGGYRTLSLPLVHDEPFHGSPEDTGRSARTDSLRNVRIDFTVLTDAPQGTSRYLPIHTAVDVRNMGLALHSSCGERPILNVAPSAQLTATPGALLTWDPAFDENNGEEDVRQYNLYRAESSAGPWQPLQSIPIDDVVSYSFEDISVQAGTTYWYALSGTDCTPAESEMAFAPDPVVIPDDEPEEEE